MNAFAERIVFFTICLQMAIIITNSTEIIPGITLNTGQVNNAYNGGFGTGSIMAWFGKAINTVNAGVTSVITILLTFGPIIPNPLDFSQLVTIFVNLWNLLVNSFIIVANLIAAGFLLLAIILGIFWGVIFGTVQFWTNVISVIDANPTTSTLWGGLIGSLQIIIVIYGIATEVSEWMGGKGKSLATGGAAGQ
jgi:hypothetical protein